MNGGNVNYNCTYNANTVNLSFILATARLQLRRRVSVGLRWYLRILPVRVRGVLRAMFGRDECGERRPRWKSSLGVAAR